VFGVERECKQNALHALIDLFLSLIILGVAVDGNLFWIVFPHVVYVGGKLLCQRDDLDL